ncbi:MAG TPA: glutaminyl-peptide cyclotransferase [Promineifilum sp.]|nr:glutaminyl-peptide cyclotransferase [Promineifilum sp.]
MNHSPLRLLVLIVLCFGALTACNRSNPPVATLAPTAVVPEQSTGDTTDTGAAAAPTTAVTAVAEAARPSATPAAPAATATPAPTPTPEPSPTPAPPPVYTFEIINTYPHDPTAFTEGLVFFDGTLYEGTGRWGESALREVALETGAVLRNLPLDAQYFGEGIAVLNDRVYQLTWQEGTGFVYDRATFAPLQTFSYTHEGWGITHDGARLIMSDGTPVIRFWDPETLQETGRITVRDNNGPVNRLNELEYVDGEIWANIWLTDLIARISPKTGDVLGYIDLTGLLDTSGLTQPVDVLNGIAYDAAGGRLFVTGKLWPSLFEIRVVPQS